MRPGSTENSANTGRSFHRSAAPSQALSQQASTLGDKTEKININHKNYLKRHGINSSRRNKTSARVLVPQNKALLMLAFRGPSSKAKTGWHLILMLEMQTHR